MSKTRRETEAGAEFSPVYSGENEDWEPLDCGHSAPFCAEVGALQALR